MLAVVTIYNHTLSVGEAIGVASWDDAYAEAYKVLQCHGVVLSEEVQEAIAENNYYFASTGEPGKEIAVQIIEVS